MADKIKEIPKQVLEWWNKFSAKQKTIIVSIVLAIIVGLFVVVRIITTPIMVTVRQCVDTEESAKVKELLDTEKIAYEVSSDGLRFDVSEKDQANAVIILGENGIPSARYDLDTVFSGGFSTTEADKSKKYQRYLEESLAEDLQALNQVESAKVKLYMPEDDGTILAKEQDTYAAVTLSLSSDMEEETAAGLAKWIATSIGDSTTDNVSIIDTKGNMLFTGGDSSSSYGSASDRLTYQTKAENLVKGKVKDVMLGTSVYDNVSVGMKLDISFNENQSTDTLYYNADGSPRGPIDNEQKYESEASGGVGGTPGTDANNGDATTYVTPDGTESSQTVTDQSTNYNTSNKVTTSISGVGDINYDDSSITVVATSYRFYNEDTLRADGKLKKMTFDEFQVKNNDKVKLEVDPDLLQMVSTATGFAEDNITIVAYEVPFFEPSTGGTKGIMDYLPLIIAAVIMLLLGYVVFRSTRKEQLSEVEPELSVESLLASTKKAQDDLADIGFTEKSETRVLIEKFVDENPEAAASLLRNWLNEEWD
ncbi:MAG: flagellar basal-body MS-ring/collar protein FliF [Lachnospiraceae bacterium]